MIVTVSKASYLGLILDSKITFKSHILSLGCKDVDIFSGLRGVIGHGWGLNRGNLQLFYKAVFIPRLTYAAGVWGDAVSACKILGLLNKIQRRALLGISCSYASISTSRNQKVTKLYDDINKVYGAKLSANVFRRMVETSSRDLGAGTSAGIARALQHSDDTASRFYRVPDAAEAVRRHHHISVVDHTVIVKSYIDKQ